MINSRPPTHLRIVLRSGLGDIGKKDIFLLESRTAALGFALWEREPIAMGDMRNIGQYGSCR